MSLNRCERSQLFNLDTALQAGLFLNLDLSSGATFTAADLLPASEVWRLWLRFAVTKTEVLRLSLRFFLIYSFGKFSKANVWYSVPATVVCIILATQSSA